MLATARSRRMVYDCWYDNIGRAGDDPCVYCGAPSTSYDHVPPLVAIERMSEQQISHAKLRKFPACAECNAMLSGHNICDLNDRTKHVRVKLRVRYRRLLNMPAWDAEELSELSPDLAEDVRRHARHAQWIKQRLTWNSRHRNIS